MTRIGFLRRRRAAAAMPSSKTLQPPGAVDRQREPERARDEAAARQARARPAAASRARSRAGRGPRRHAAHPRACTRRRRRWLMRSAASGEMAISCRSAFSMSTGYCSCFQLSDARRSARAACEVRCSAACVAGVERRVVPERERPLDSVVGGVDRLPAPSHGSSSRSSRIRSTAIQRPRNVAVSSQRVSSQPATFGG